MTKTGTTHAAASESANSTQATERSAHTPGEWFVERGANGSSSIVIWSRQSEDSGDDRHVVAVASYGTMEKRLADARLIAAAPDLLAALLNVRKIISEASMTGFNCHTGDWAERLFASQSVSSRAIARATRGQP